jgi:hypothetical protein
MGILAGILYPELALCVVTCRGREAGIYAGTQQDS